MTKETVKAMVDNHNTEIQNYLENELYKEMGKKDNKSFSMSDWFKAQELIGKQNFYKKGMEILTKCRDNGYDVKMNMQSNKLVWYGGMI